MPANSFHNYGSITREEALVFLGSGQLAGLQSVNLSYENNAVETKYLGMGKCKTLPVGPQIGGFNLSYYVVSQDLVLQFTGHSGTNGYILRARNNNLQNFSFTSGYLTSYTSRVSVGSIPEVSANFAIFGNVGAISQAYSAQTLVDRDNILASLSALSFKPTNYSSISLNLDDFSTNRVISYEINMSISRLPIYKLGQREPSQVKRVPPILVDINFVIEKNDYIAKQIQHYPFQEKIRNLEIRVRDFNRNEPVITYGFDNMMLRTESYNLTTDNRGVYQLGYRNYFI